MLEQGNVLGSLICFHTKLTFTEDVIGFPCMFTTNPKTKRVDYAMPCFDVMSASAFYDEGLRKSADNDSIDTLIPLYITDEHFSRALPYIERAAVVLCPHLGNHFRPEMVLHFMPVLLSTVVVLISDKGVTASEKAIDAYCALHRLFLALIDHYRLHSSVESTVARFIAQPMMRAKSECPSLGNFVSLISVCTSDRTSWTSALPAIMTEAFNRAILWICQKDPCLVSTLQAAHRTDADPELLSAVFASQTVMLRLWMVHATFVGLIARPRGVGQDQVKYDYDSLYGMPSAPVKTLFQRRIGELLQVQSWADWFRLVGLEPMTPHAMTAVLRQSWSNSLKLGYHKKGMDFQAVHRSGVSRLLMKGESYSAPANMQRLKLNERWRWATAGHVQFLDASALVFDQQGRCVKTVDYRRTQWTVPGKGTTQLIKRKDGVFELLPVAGCVPVQHSGDVLDHEQALGTHPIDLDLRLVPETVQCIYITVSAFAEAVLSDIRLPFVEVCDEATGTVLCEYHMEDRSKLAKSKSIIMCCIARSGPRWTVRAIGKVGQGSASDYGPLIEACAQDFREMFSRKSDYTRK
jgi:stress response protein SCP2